MVKYRKRLEALSEVYQSEISYIDDLKIWAEEFRRYLFQSETLTIEKKHALSRSLFINLDSIISLHELIVKELDKRNEDIYNQVGEYFKDEDGNNQITPEIAEKYKDLEYHSVYFKFIDRFSIYKYYVTRLPTVEFNLDRECAQNINFARELSHFFTQRNINLGPKHFIYRASQKLARYTILWKAVLHYESDESYHSGIEELMKRLKEITLEVDRAYGSINESYRIYRLSSEIHYSDSIERRIPLNLFQKKRAILLETDVIVKNQSIAEAKVLRFILLNTVILLCDVVRQGNIEIKYIISNPLALYRYTITDKNIGFKVENPQLQKKEKLFLLERGGKDIVVLFLSDTNTKKMFQRIIENAIEEQRKHLRSDLVLRNILEETNLKILCLATRITHNKVLHLQQNDEKEAADKKEEKNKRFVLEEMTEFEKSVIKIMKKSDQKQSKAPTNGNYFEEESSEEEKCKCGADKRLLERGRVERKHGRKVTYETEIHKSDESDENNSEEQSNENDSEINPDSESSVKPEPSQERKKSLLNRFFGERSRQSKTRSFNLGRGNYSKSLKFDEQLLLFGTDQGLFIKKGNEFLNIYNRSVEKIIYDVSHKIILFLSEKKIKCASFVPKQTVLDAKTIENNVANFFYGNTANKLTIASLSVSNSATTTISLFKVVFQDNTFSIVMDRKLFVGCLVFEISFFEAMLVIACKDFEMVDSDTLKTQELVDPLDLCVPFYFKELSEITALCVFTLNPNLFLVCYDAIGFFIDKYGRTVNQNVVFVWYFAPVKFKVFGGYLICLGKSEMAIWSISTGQMIYTKRIENLSFVEGSTSILLHDTHNMYKINIDN